MSRISFDSFERLTNNFYEYFGREKRPGRRRLEMLLDSLSGYSGDELQEAFSYMKDTLDSVPYNIPKAIKAAIFILNKSKPEVNTTFKAGMYGLCDDCNGMGIFKLLVYDGFKNRSEPIQYCSRCDNWKFWTNEPGDRISKAELEGAGYKFKPYNKCLIKPKDIKPMGTSLDVEEMATLLGKNKNMESA